MFSPEIPDYRPHQKKLTVSFTEMLDREVIVTFREHAVRIGNPDHLVGVVTVPVVSRSGPPAIVMLNAGVLHRVGPHRLHVQLARRLATQGFPCLRIDLAGIGDSLATASSLTFRESAVADTRTVMTELETTIGARRFVVFGLCSGADNAIATAAVDDRVAAIVLVDPTTYATRRSRARKLARRLAALGAQGPRSVVHAGIGVARRQVRARIAALRQRGRDEAAEPDEGRETPPLAVYRSQLDQLLARGVKILMIYSGSLGDGYNHRDQLFEYGPELRGRVDHRYFPDANHTFTERAAQTALIDEVTAWIDRQFR